MDAGVFESAPVQSPPGSHHRPGAHHRDRNRVLSFPQNAGGTAEKESLVAFRASTELSRGRDSGRRPFLGAPSRLSSDRTGGSVISTLEEKDSYDVGGAKSDGHGGAESSCQKQQSSPGGEHMDILAQLKAERDKAAQQVNALDTAIKALSGLNSTGATRGRRTMSAAARARISASQKARWARTRGQKVVSIAPKRHISAAGLARIRAAQRARWAKIRKQQS